MKLICINTWGGKVYHPLIKFIKNHSKDTDIFCFQEVFNTTSNIKTHSGYRLNLYRELSKILKSHNGYFNSGVENYIAGSFQKNLIDFNLFWGLAIFIRKNLKVISQGDFFVYGQRGSFNPKDENSVPRNVQYIKFVNNNKIFTICNLHGVWIRGPKDDNPFRIKQSQMIKKFLDDQKGSKILVGDFNLGLHTESLKILESNLSNLIKKNNISTTRNKLYDRTDDKHADYILVSKDINVTDFKVPYTEVSDHLPLILEFS